MPAAFQAEPAEGLKAELTENMFDETFHMIDPINHCFSFISFGQIIPCGHMDIYDPIVTVIYLHLR